MANLFESMAFDHLDNIERDIDRDTDTDLFGFETIWKNNHNTKPIEWTELVDNPMIVGELVGISTGMVIDGIDFYFKQKKEVPYNIALHQGQTILDSARPGQPAQVIDFEDVRLINEKGIRFPTPPFSGIHKLDC